MALETVQEYFKIFNIENRIIILDETTATVKDAAFALKTDTNNIAKSLAFLINEEPIVIVTSGDSRIDNRKYMDYFNKRAKMIKSELVEEIIGHKVGGVCPFAVKDNVSVYLDITLKDLTEVYPACGSTTSSIKLSLKELEKYSNYKKWIDVCQ